MTYSPLAGGWLSGKYRKGQQVSGPGSPARSRRFPAPYDASDPSNAAKLDAVDGLGALADEAGHRRIPAPIGQPRPGRAAWIS